MSTLKNDLIDILSSKLDYFSPIVVTGNSGVGKTRFLEMLKEELSDNQDENAIEIYNAEVISSSMLSALRSANMDAWRESFKKNSILMIDDFNYLGGKSSAQEELLSILRSVDVPIIISISRPISCGGFSDEMVSFFDNATHIHLKEPSHTEISEYIIKLLKDNGVRLSEEALNWLLSQNIESYAKAQGIIKTLSLYCSSYEKIVDIEICKEIITPMIGMISKVFFEV